MVGSTNVREYKNATASSIVVASNVGIGRNTSVARAEILFKI